MSFSNSQSTSSASTVDGGSTSTTCPPGAAPAPAPAGPNARQRRSAARSARRHAVRRHCNRTMLVLLFIVRLRRLRDSAPGHQVFLSEPPTSAVLASTSKRGTDERPASRASTSSLASSLGCGAESTLLMPPPPDRAPRDGVEVGKRRKEGLASGFLLR
eukprot:6938006-Prymnesium_polylepis.4